MRPSAAHGCSSATELVKRLICREAVGTGSVRGSPFPGADGALGRLRQRMDPLTPQMDICPLPALLEDLAMNLFRGFHHFWTWTQQQGGIDLHDLPCRATCA